MTAPALLLQVSGLPCSPDSIMCMGCSCSPALPGKSASPAAMAHAFRGGLEGGCNNAAASGAAAALPGIPPGAAAVPCSHSPDCEGVLQKVSGASKHGMWVPRSLGDSKRASFTSQEGQLILRQCRSCCGTMATCCHVACTQPCIWNC